MKTGVGIADVMCGMYAAVGILAALRHRDRTGEGQQIDLSLVDSQMAWLVNEGTNYLASGQVPTRRGNGHPNIVPYDVFEAADGHVIIAVGNDAQFIRFCDFLGLPDLAKDPAYQTNPARIMNRIALLAILAPALTQHTMANIITGLETRKVPVGPINTVEQALRSDQAAARDTIISVAAEGVVGGSVQLLGNPLKLSRTPIQYRAAPPRFGQDTDEVLAEYSETKRS
jgi:formyl-CoA transferase